MADEIRALSDGVRAEVVIECLGAPVAFPTAIYALRMHGRLVVVAAYEKPVKFTVGP